MDSLLLSYAQILFLPSRAFGLTLFALTWLSPAQGAAGALSAWLAMKVAKLAGLATQPQEEVRFGLNAALLGLALGSYFTWSPAFALLLALASAGSVVVTACVGYASLTYFGVPALSLPFSLTAILALLAAWRIGDLQPALPDHGTLLALPPGFFPAILENFLGNLGSVVFQASATAGLLIAAALLWISPLTLLLLSTGYAASLAAIAAWGLDPLLFTREHLGFNPMLSALALGGIYVFPRLATLGLAAFSALSTLLMLAALRTLLPDALPLLALPFNLTAMSVLLTLRLRRTAASALTLVEGEPGHPEGNLREDRLKRERLALSLPFFGQWKVSQGFDGPYTHQGLWRHAYDFQAIGIQGGLFRGEGLELEDYYTFGSAVLAPADGIVCEVMNTVPDNLIGSEDLARNWGNYVIIRHSPDRFSCLAHFKKGSIVVSPGQAVRRGEFLGQCGNSGRSAYPHLHFQMQGSPALGAPTIPFEFGKSLPGRAILEPETVVTAQATSAFSSEAGALPAFGSITSM